MRWHGQSERQLDARESGPDLDLRRGTDPTKEPETGQGCVYDPVRRKKIEDAAQAWLMQHYRHLGFTVTDNAHWSALRRRGPEFGAVLFLEAKGTTSDGARVVVTRNQVAWAKANLGQCVMGIWSGMTFGINDEVDPSKGARKIYYWQPEDHELEPIDYDWHVPVEKQMWPNLNHD